jgi:hypothetical protein
MECDAMMGDGRVASQPSARRSAMTVAIRRRAIGELLGCALRSIHAAVSSTNADGTASAKRVGGIAQSPASASGDLWPWFRMTPAIIATNKSKTACDASPRCPADDRIRQCRYAVKSAQAVVKRMTAIARGLKAPDIALVQLVCTMAAPIAATPAMAP